MLANILLEHLFLPSSVCLKQQSLLLVPYYTTPKPVNISLYKIYEINQFSEVVVSKETRRKLLFGMGLIIEERGLPKHVPIKVTENYVI
jgi:hypothetical protein